jgi:hypothetical protein
MPGRPSAQAGELRMNPKCASLFPLKTKVYFDSPEGRKMRNEFISLFKYALRKVHKQSYKVKV